MLRGVPIYLTLTLAPHIVLSWERKCHPCPLAHFHCWNLHIANEEAMFDGKKGLCVCNSVLIHVLVYDSHSPVLVYHGLTRFNKVRQHTLRPGLQSSKRATPCDSLCPCMLVRALLEPHKPQLLPYISLYGMWSPRSPSLLHLGIWIIPLHPAFLELDFIHP